jgi:glycosyltransferase involved in cell wall biosynthesis
MKISVALCTYNGENYLSKQIESILNQSFQTAIEIVVCDDRSTDTTLSILNHYKNLHPNVFNIYVNENNLGSTKNFEKAISNCTGDFIFLSDQDDIWDKDKIAKTLAVFENNPNAEGVFSNAFLINEKEDVFTDLSLWETVYFLEKELPKPIDFLDIITKNGNIVTGATLCIKKEIKKHIFPLPIDVLHDEWIATILAIKQTLYYTTEKLISYRIHSSQQVGIKDVNKIEGYNHIKRVILGIEKPESFRDFRILTKKYFLKRNELIKIDNYNLELENLKELIAISSNNCREVKTKMKTKFPIQYRFTKIVDVLLGKRKL